MAALFRLIFGAVTTASYHLRFLLIIAVACALIASIMAHETPFKAGPVTLPWFTIVTVTLFLAISVPLKWRRLIIERPYFHRTAMGTVSAPFAAIFIVVTTFIEAAALTFATLFTFPFEKGPEFRWTLYLLLATGLISYLVLWVLDRCKWKAARWTYFLLPIPIGVLFAVLVHIVSTGSMLRAKSEEASGFDPYELARQVTPDLKSDRGIQPGHGDENGRQWLFKAPSDNDAVAVLAGFFGKGIFQAAWEEYGRAVDAYNTQISNSNSKLAEAKDSLDSLSADLQPLCKSLAIEDANFGYRFPGKGEAFSDGDSISIVKKCGELKRSWFISKDGKYGFLGKERRLVDDICSGVESLRVASEDAASNVREGKLILWMNLRCGAAIGDRYCNQLKYRHQQTAFEKDSDDWKELRSCEQDLNETVNEASNKITSIQSALDGARQSTPDAEIGPLQAYSILDGYLQAKIINLIGRFYVYHENAVTFAKSGQDDRLTDDICDHIVEAPSDAGLDPRLVDWCAPKSTPRALATIVLSPYMLQGFVLSVYVTALLLAFRRRDQGDPDRPAQELLNAPDEQGRQTFATAGAGAIPDNPPRSAPLALRERRVATTKRAFFDWHELEQLPSVIDPAIWEIEVSEPTPIAEIPAIDDGAIVDDSFDRPIHLGEFRIPAPDPKRFAQEQAKLHAALMNFANAVADVGAKGASAKDEWCKVFGPPLKYLLAKCPSEIRVHHELGSGLQDDLATEFRIYESLYFGSRDPAEIAKAFAKYERLRPVLRNSSDVVDVRSLKGLTDDQLCFLISLASAAAIGAVFK